MKTIILERLAQAASDADCLTQAISDIEYAVRHELPDTTAEPIPAGAYAKIAKPDNIEPLNGGAVLIWYDLPEDQLRHLQALSEHRQLITIQRQALENATHAD